MKHTFAKYPMCVPITFDVDITIFNQSTSRVLLLISVYIAMSPSFTNPA